jgi:hypothetical protein
MRNFIWGLNGRFQKDLPRVTRTLDRMPLIETEQSSGFSFEGEFAQILPNPNPINNRATGDPNGVAFIDDFEGSKRTKSIPILRRFWRESSAPTDYKTGEGLPNEIEESSIGSIRSFRCGPKIFGPTYQHRFRRRTKQRILCCFSLTIDNIRPIRQRTPFGAGLLRHLFRGL